MNTSIKEPTESTVLRLPQNVKKRIFRIYSDRKLNGKEKTTQGKVYLELLEIGLKLLEKQEQATEQEVKA